MAAASATLDRVERGAGAPTSVRTFPKTGDLETTAFTRVTRDDDGTL